MMQMFSNWIFGSGCSTRKRKNFGDLCALPSAEQLECRALMTALVAIPEAVGAEVLAIASVDTSSSLPTAESSRRDARVEQHGRRTPTDALHLAAVITSESGSLNGNLLISINRRLKTTGTFATTGIYGFFQVSGWSENGTVVTFHGSGVRRLRVPVQGYSHLETLVQLTIDKSNGIIQGTLQPTLYGRKLAPLAAAPVPFTGLVAAAQ